MKKVIFSILILFSAFTSAFSQFLEDKSSQQTVVQALNYIYNAEYSLAEKTLLPVYKKYENHPVSELLKATVLSWKHKPIEKNQTMVKKYLAHLNACQEKAVLLLKRDESIKAEATFYLLSAHGFIARVHHHNKDYIKAGIEAKSAYGYLKDGFTLVHQNPDFHFTNGLYLYYRERYPEIHPQIKPIIYFFKSGDKAKGLASLKKATQEALFSKVEAENYYGGILLKYENRNMEAFSIYRGLVKRYPNNADFYLRYIQSLHATKQFDKMGGALSKLNQFQGIDQKLGYLLFKGLYEFQIGNFAEAKIDLKKVESFGEESSYTEDFQSMAKLTLGKIALKEGNETLAEDYFEESENLAEYYWVRKELTELLKK
ncbi:hypothetical protein [Jiulongibacter sp. NS-SX5]|uniref:hypothetical protein n=1 Tax=Jiulongibacter sp. NS-SX5 TaxID=3463854 RepID=UPI0040586482